MEQNTHNRPIVMKQLHRHPILRATLLAAFASLVTACGGGGDSGSTATPTATSDPIDKYATNFTVPCALNGEITSASTGASLYSKITASFQSKVSATKMLYQLKIESYAAKDCSGAPLGTITAAGDNNFWQIDGTAVIGADTVDKLTFSKAPFFPGISAAKITINGVSYSGKWYGYQTPVVGKDILLLKGSDLYGGDYSKPMDAQGYPTAVEAVASTHKM
jgi:hypothetical protein